VRSLSSIPRPLLLALAIVFAGTLILYSAVWLYYAGWEPPVRIGIQWQYQLTPYLTIQQVKSGSPADRAGLQENDQIVSVNGYPQHGLSVAPAFVHGKPGDVLSIVAQRPGVARPLNFQVTLEATPPRPPLPPARWLAVTLIDYYPVHFLVVGLSGAVPAC
jgi:membrane-associated protease RseP (regulator of RpoE activity)